MISMKSKSHYPTLSSEHFYMDEKPTQVSFTSLLNSPSSSSHAMSVSPLKSYANRSPGLVSSPRTFTANEVGATTGTSTKKGMLSKVFGRRKSTSSTTMLEKSPRSQHLTKNLSSKALDCLQASEQFGPTDRGRTTPTCSDLSGESGAAEVPNTSHYPESMQKDKSNAIGTNDNDGKQVPFRRGNITDLLERIPNLPPMRTPIWIKPAAREERAHVSPKRRTSLCFDNNEDSFSMIESPRPASASVFALGLKPPPLTFQESDKKMPAVKSPPMPQTESADTTEDLVFEIEPGHSLQLRGRKQETKNYIQGGKDIATQECVCCGGMIHCVGDASFLLCPFCRVVQPLLLTSSEREAYGLALGFSSQEWIEMSSEDAWSTV